jgi:DNA (cytosine-5)-methyltransferase 1
MKHISLFSGIGGFDLAAEWMGWENIASCEINPFCNRILSHYWPDAYHHDDIHTLTIDLLNEKISKKYPDWQSDDIILTGGFPCQPYSQAGKRLGKEDSRHLWPEMLRVIRQVRPKYIVGENVSGLVNWSDGLVFEEVQVDLENEGYEVQAFILPAAAVGAPHRRDRVWFIANANSNRSGRELSKMEGKNEEKQGQKGQNDSKYRNIGRERADTNTNDQGCKRDRAFAITEKQITFGGRHRHDVSGNTWQNFPSQSPVCTGNDGIPARLDGITFPKWRNESIKAAGNAIVPQVAFRIFQAIERNNEQNSVTSP